MRHALNSHHPIHLGFQADSPCFVLLVSKYQTAECRAVLSCQSHIFLKEIHKVCGSGESGLFCLKVDFDFVTFVKLVIVALGNPHVLYYRLLTLHLITHSLLQACLLFLKRNKVGGKLQRAGTHFLCQRCCNAKERGEWHRKLSL